LGWLLGSWPINPPEHQRDRNLLLAIIFTVGLVLISVLGLPASQMRIKKSAFPDRSVASGQTTPINGTDFAISEHRLLRSRKACLAFLTDA
jgi:hypothetical protein